MTPEEIIAEIRATHRQRHGQPSRETIEAGRVRDYLCALDEPVGDLAAGAAVPSMFLLTLGRTRRPQPARGTSVNAGDEYEFHAPVRVGDVIEVRKELLDVEAKQGRAGPMYLCRTRTTFTNARGDLVAVSHQDVLRWNL